MKTAEVNPIQRLTCKDKQRFPIGGAAAKRKSIENAAVFAETKLGEGNKSAVLISGISKIPDMERGTARLSIICL